MKKYVGIKIIEAEPCNYFNYYADKYGDEAFNKREFKIHENKPGYKVVYPPDKYMSWSPKEVFDEAYFDTENLTFDRAFYLIMRGYCVKRTCEQWKKDYLYYSKKDNMLIKMLGRVPISYRPLEKDMFTNDWEVVKLMGGKNEKR